MGTFITAISGHSNGALKRVYDRAGAGVAYRDGFSLNASLLIEAADWRLGQAAVAAIVARSLS